jgi:hypothetical protein
MWNQLDSAVYRTQTDLSDVLLTKLTVVNCDVGSGLSHYCHNVILKILSNRQQREIIPCNCFTLRNIHLRRKCQHIRRQGGKVQDCCRYHGVTKKHDTLVSLQQFLQAAFTLFSALPLTRWVLTIPRTYRNRYIQDVQLTRDVAKGIRSTRVGQYPSRHC